MPNKIQNFEGTHQLYLLTTTLLSASKALILDLKPLVEKDTIRPVMQLVIQKLITLMTKNIGLLNFGIQVLEKIFNILDKISETIDLFSLYIWYFTSL